MEKLIMDNQNYEYYEYEKEVEFEKMIVDNSCKVFGESSIYFDVKKKIGDEIVSIPDGYLIDFTIPGEPRLYIIENELVKHDPYRHIGQQILRFAISYKASGRKIKRVLLKDIQKKKQSMDLVNKILKRDDYRNIDALLEDIIFDKEVGCIVVIDESTSELENVLSQLSIKTDIIQFQTFKNNEGSMIHKFEEFQSDIKSTATSAGIRDLEELDTVVVPAREDGFNDVFLEKDCWYSIRMSGAMVDRIKYIAAYQVAPVSAITHMAEVSRIERYENTNKYILYFKEPAHEIKAIVLPNDKKGLAPQSPRYTSFARIKNAKTLKDIFRITGLGRYFRLYRITGDGSRPVKKAIFLINSVA